MKEYTFEDYRNIVEKHLMDFIPDVDHKSITLYESMKYSLSAGGKRIRPVLLLATCDFCGGSIEEALPYACALEYIHNYSLIHDDPAWTTMICVVEDRPITRCMARRWQRWQETVCRLLPLKR